jgi:DNA-binding beta-propeller fold protein YncE
MNRALPSLAILALSVAAGSACGGHGDHSSPELGPPAKGGLDVRGPALFVALGKTGEVAVIATDSWMLAGKVKVSSSFYPHHLGLSPDRSRITVGAPTSDLSGGHAGHGSGDTTGGLFVMDATTGDVLVQRRVAGTAHNLAYLADGNILVYALSEHGMIHMADPSTLQDVGTVMVGGAPLEATPLPGTTTVLVSNSSAGTITAVDIATKRVIKRLDVGSNPIAAWLASQSLALVTSEADRKLSGIDLQTLSVTKTVTLGGVPGQALATADGKEVWVAYEDKGVVAILSFPGLDPVAEVTIGQRPHGLAVSADGRSVFVTDEGMGKILEVDVASRSVKRSLDVGGFPNGILLRPGP